MAARKAVRAIVSGRVQGVGFRWSARLKAGRLGLAGWIRNLPDGDVETHAEGSPKAVEEYLAWLADGPPGSRVDSVRTFPAAAGGYVSFDIDD